MTRTVNPSEDSHATQSVVENGMATAHLMRELLKQFSMTDADATLRWLELGEYIAYTGWGVMAPKIVVQLTAKGIALAESGRLPAEERNLVYQEDPYCVFVARQFRREDAELFELLRDAALAPRGLTTLDGTVDGVEAFRGEILRKIRRARYFVCLLTRRDELAAGGFASSVWLYQETGAAVALGKKPLVLVEDGMHGHYAGELQKNYEYVPFTRGAPADAFEEVARRITADLTANRIPLASA